LKCLSQPTKVARYTNLFQVVACSEFRRGDGICGFVLLWSQLLVLRVNAIERPNYRRCLANASRPAGTRESVRSMALFHKARPRKRRVSTQHIREGSNLSAESWRNLSRWETDTRGEPAAAASVPTFVRFHRENKTQHPPAANMRSENGKKAHQLVVPLVYALP